MIRLLELRTEKGISQRQMAKVLYISQATYNNWENGKTQPPIEQMFVIADYFKVSLDYLLGHSDDYGIIKINDKLKEDQILLLKRYDALSEESKKILLEFLRSITKS